MPHNGTKEQVPMAFDAFLKIDGIKGESIDSVHKDEIEIESYSWGMTQTGSSSTGGGGGAGKAQLHDFSFVKKTDKASPNIMHFCATGKHIKEIFFVIRKAGGTQLEFLKFKFTDVIISSYQTGGSSRAGEDIPMESISFNFTQIDLDYQEQGADGKAKGGPVHGGWNMKTNQKT
jgi:type VI secretion system secreted protein Hcp